LAIYEILENRIWADRWTIDLVIEPEKEGITKAQLGKVHTVGNGSHYCVYLDKPDPITAFKNGVNKISRFKLETQTKEQ
jgi:hypothetical protein